MFGPMAMVLFFGVGLCSTLWLVRTARRLNAQSFPEVGEGLCGRPGKLFFELFQVLNLLMFLPVALVICAGALQGLAPDSSFMQCNIHVTGILVGVGFLIILLAQRLRHAVSAIQAS